MSTNNQHGGVNISNREIYDTVMKLKSQVTMLTVTNTIVMGIIAYLVIEGLK